MSRECSASSEMPAPHVTWSGFYKKTLKERQQQVKLAFPSLFTTAPEPSSVASSVYVTPDTSPCQSPVSADFAHAFPGERPSSSQLPNGSPQGDPMSEQCLSTVNSRLVALKLKEESNDQFPINGLDEHVAENMIENCVGTIGLPVGLALNFVINGKPIVIPMAIEEPSVVAAVSGAAKTISSYRGFTASAPEDNVIIAQIALLDIPPSSMDHTVRTILQNKDQIINVANGFCDNMVRRGGGVIDVSTRRIWRLPNQNKNHRPVADSDKFNEWLIVHLHIGVCEAMGANCANTVAEGVAPFLSELTGGRIGLRIVSNLSAERIAKASFRIPLPMLGYKNCTGKEVAERILEAYEWAEVDPYRATTHNKGIMNGIDAVAIATGQDWRAIEAAAHAWACDGVRNNGGFGGSYRPLTSYWIEEDEDPEAADKTGDQSLVFCGALELPIGVGTTGGVLKSNPVYSINLGIMNYPNAKELAMAMVSVGLAQNFAALRALATEGIQLGHMSLHAKNLVIAAECPPQAIASITEKLIESNRINLSAAREYIDAYKLSEQASATNPGKSRRRSKYGLCDGFQTPLDCVHM